MTRPTIIAIALLLLALASATPAGAADPGTCSVDVTVDFLPDGTIVQSGPGAARCAGSLGPAGVDPLASAHPLLSGAAREGASSCTPVLLGGQLSLSPRRFVSFDGRDSRVEFGSTWAAAGLTPVTVVRGTGYAEGYFMDFVGEARYTPRSANCSLGGFSPGTLHFDLVIGEGRARSRPASAPAAEATPAGSHPRRSSSRRRAKRTSRSRSCPRRVARPSKAPKRRCRPRGRR